MARPEAPALVPVEVLVEEDEVGGYRPRSGIRRARLDGASQRLEEGGCQRLAERVREGEYKRFEPAGNDRIQVDPDGRRHEFSVMLSFYPQAMEPVFSLSPDKPDKGFPCGPYLTPKIVSQRRRAWSYGSAPKLESSLDAIVKALDEVGLPWLERLCDTQVFASEIDKHAVLPAALALELAGDRAAARALYEEMYRRLRGVIESEGTDENVFRERGRVFIFVCSKLGVEAERVERYSQRSGCSFQGPPL